MALFDATFETFEAADFETFAPRAWSSNRFNLQRQRVRLRLTAWLERVLGALPEGFELVATLDHPHVHNGRSVALQEVAVCRARELRDRMQAIDAAVDAEYPEQSHPRFGARVDGEGASLFFTLPAGASFDRATVASVRSELAALADAFGATMPDAVATDASGATLSFERRWPSADALQQPAEALDDALRALVPSALAALAAFDAALTLPDADADSAPATAPAASTAADADADADAATVHAVAVQSGSASPQRSASTAAAAEPSAPYARRPRPEPVRPVAPPNERPLPAPYRKAAPARPTIAAPGSASPDPVEVALQQARDQALAILRGGNDDAPARRDDRRSGPGAGARSDAGRGRQRPQANRRGDDARDSSHGAGYGSGGGRGGSRRPFEVGPHAPAAKPTGLAVGARVQLRAGLLAGKEAEILAITGKQARVSAGGFEVSVALSDLVPMAD